MKADCDFKTIELKTARDSISILLDKTKTQDTLLQQYTSVIALKDTLIQLKDSIIIQREQQVVDLNKNNATLKKQRNRAIASGTLGIILGVLIIIVF